MDVTFNPFEVKRRCDEIAEYCRLLSTHPRMNNKDVPDLRRMVSNVLFGADLAPTSRQEALNDVARLAEQIAGMNLKRVKRVKDLVRRLEAAAALACDPFKDLRS
jgi:hypothetical protein